MKSSLSQKESQKESRKRKAPPTNNSLTNYFASNLEIKSDDGESKENIGEPEMTHKHKNRKLDGPSLASQPASQKITIFLKKDQNTITVQTQESDTNTKDTKDRSASKPKTSKGKGPASQGTLSFMKSAKNGDRKASPPRIPKKTIMDFNKRIDQAYIQEEFPIMGVLLEKMNEDLKRRFNVKKVERFLNTSMRQFLRSSPDHLWSSVYRPMSQTELMSDRYANMIKFWLRKFIRDQRYRMMESRETSRTLSDVTEESLGFGHPDILKELEELRFNLDEQELLKKMKYKSLLLVGKEGRGKLSLVHGICNDMNLEAIEICNSNNRSSSCLDQIYEATQSQNVFMSTSTSEKASQESRKVSSREDLAPPAQMMTNNSKQSVIIVRDFDKPLEIDKGFQNKILKLAETSKSPFILICEKVPKRLRKQQDQSSLPPIDQFQFEKLVLDDIALLFYVVLTIERNFSKMFKEFRYQSYSKCPEFPEDYKQELSKLLNGIDPKELKVLSCFDDIFEMTKFFEGNLTCLFSKLEFHKDLIYERNISELKKECFLASESKYRKKHDIFIRFDKDYFSKQALDTYRGSAKKSFLSFSTDLDYLSGINKLTRGLDFFQELQKETNSDSKTEKALNNVIDRQGNYNELAKTAEFLDRMGTLDILENTILKSKIEPDWSFVADLYNDETTTKQQRLTDGQGLTVIPINKDDTWNKFEIQEKTFYEIQKDGLLNKEYLATLLKNPLDERVPVLTSPYDEDLVMKMVWKLKKGVFEMFSDIFGKHCKDLFCLNEFIVTLGTMVDPEYKAAHLKGRLRKAKSIIIDPREKSRIQANIYIKSMLCHELREIRRSMRANLKSSKEADPENPFGLTTKDNDIDDLIKILMTFSYGFFNKENFSSFHTQVMRDCE